MTDPTPTTAGAAPTPAAEPDRIIWRSELRECLGLSGETIRKYLRDKKLPQLDVDLSLRSKGWRLSTLRAAGINVPFEPLRMRGNRGQA